MRLLVGAPCFLPSVCVVDRHACVTRMSSPCLAVQSAVLAQGSSTGGVEVIGSRPQVVHQIVGWFCWPHHALIAMFHLPRTHRCCPRHAAPEGGQHGGHAHLLQHCHVSSVTCQIPLALSPPQACSTWRPARGTHTSSPSARRCAGQHQGSKYCVSAHEVLGQAN